jgi:hypothetical protein
MNANGPTRYREVVLTHDRALVLQLGQIASAPIYHKMGQQEERC